MNRRQKIIVSVTGIFLVLLILVGLTYAYFLTKIQGNSETKSISVTTANLVLEYGDGNGILEPAENLLPGNTVKFKTASNEVVEYKTFTVSNKGNATADYVVLIKDVSIIDVSTSTATTFVSPSDFVYTLTCTSDDGTSCQGVDSAEFPMNGGIVVGNNIAVDATHTYTLTMKYLETGVDQSDDMNKTLTAKIDIADSKEINPYSDSTTSLAYNIIDNAKLNKNGTELVGSPISGVATSVSGKNYTTTITESTASISSVSSTYGAYWWTYADGYTLDPENGFTLTGVHTCQYSSCYGDLTGKYLVSNSASGNGYTLNTTKPVSGLTTIYKVTTAGTSATGSVSLTKYTISTTTVSESILSTAQDEYGTSYYYRGEVEDNYVNFAGMCWRAVRIAGDGSIKLTLEDQDQECSSSMNGNFDIASAAYGYTLENSKYKINYLNSEGGMADGLESFQTNKLSSVTGKLKAGDWCYDGTTYQDAAGLIPLGDTSSYYTNGTSFYYGTYTRLYNQREASLGCAGEKMNAYRTGTTMYVGALTADEVVYAGGKAGSSNYDYYLINDYQEEEYIYWWTLSPSYFDGDYDSAFSVDYDGSVYNNLVVSDDNDSLRPAVSLASGVEISSGDGSIDNPYTIN